MTEHDYTVPTADELQEYRLSLDVTQQEVATVTNIDLNKIQELEDGGKASYKTLEAVMTLYRMVDDEQQYNLPTRDDLRQYRMDADISQDKAGAIVGISGRMICQFEGGKHGMSLKYINRLVTLYRILCERTNDEPPTETAIESDRSDGLGELFG